MLERAFVATVLLTVTLTGRRGLADLLACAAVLLSFAHGQIADRMAEAQEARPVVDVHCYRQAARYWLAKEVVWIAYFITTRAYPAIVGCVVFAAYPSWRKLWRRVHPREAMR
jgi:hypothetical protein